LKIEIRTERLQEIEAIRNVNDRAFGQPQEGRIIDRLRDMCDGLLSLVALVDEQVVGHILFTPVTIEGPVVVHGLGLAPMAVLPEFQRRGIGTKLVTEALKVIGASPCPFVVVLGHADYYSRFGFQRASERRLECPWENVPDDAFMVLVLDEPLMTGVIGVVRFRDEFERAGQQPATT
jgi:putative acetyltransferase